MVLAGSAPSVGASTDGAAVSTPWASATEAIPSAANAANHPARCGLICMLLSNFLLWVLPSESSCRLSQVGARCRDGIVGDKDRTSLKELGCDVVIARFAPVDGPTYHHLIAARLRMCDGTSNASSSAAPGGIGRLVDLDN